MSQAKRWNRSSYIYGSAGGGLMGLMRCDKCVTKKELCQECCDNPIYKDVPKYSMFQAYIPACPKGLDGCVCDPAYIKYIHPEWYKELYGDMTPAQAAAKNCDVNDEYCYDDEDK
jgi:hypothetical protein